MVAHSRVWKCSVGWPLRVRLEQFRTVDLGGAVVLGAVERDQHVRSEPPERRKPAGALERRDHRAEHRKQVIGRDRVKQGADVVVGRDAAHAEQRLAVRAPVALLEPALERQERRALGEEQRESAQADIDHGIARVRSRALVREPLAAAPHGADQAVEHLHAEVESDSKQPEQPTKALSAPVWPGGLTLGSAKMRTAGVQERDFRLVGPCAKIGRRWA